MWVAATETTRFYAILPGRGFKQAKELLDEDYAGTIERDGWVAYRKYEKADHQTCYNHLQKRSTIVNE